MYSVCLSLRIVFLLKRSRYYCYLKKYENFKIWKCLTCKMKLFIALTKIASFTFNLFVITVIIIIINLILTLIFSLIFSYIIWHLNFDCHPSQTVQAQQDDLYIQQTGTYLSKRRLPVHTDTCCCAFVGRAAAQLNISIRDSGAGLRVDECGRVLLEPPSSHTALGFPSNL